MRKVQPLRVFHEAAWTDKLKEGDLVGDRKAQVGQCPLLSRSHWLAMEKVIRRLGHAVCIVSVQASDSGQRNNKRNREGMCHIRRCRGTQNIRILSGCL